MSGVKTSNCVHGREKRAHGCSFLPGSRRWVAVAVCVVSCALVAPPPRARGGLVCVRRWQEHFFARWSIGHVPCDVQARFGWQFPPTHGGHMLFHEPCLEVRGRYLFVYKPFLSVVTLELLVGSQKNQLC